MKRIRQLIGEENGNTLVEMIVTLLLISMMFAMAAATLSSAFRIFLRVQKEQYASSVLDTTMTQLKTLTEDAVGYVKIYQEDGSPLNQTGAGSGGMLEYLNTEGYVTVLSASGCPVTSLYTAGQHTGNSEAVEAGRLLARYYQPKDGRYLCMQNGSPVAKDLVKVFADRFYMGNYLGITFSYLDTGGEDGQQITAIRVQVSLYSDAARTKVAAQDSEILDLRYQTVRKDQITAVSMTE